jgi:hypothetical protein
MKIISRSVTHPKSTMVIEMSQPIDQEIQIITEINKLNIARGDKMRDFLKEYDAKFHDPEIKKVQENCEKNIGHKWVEDGYTIGGFKIRKCELCHLTEIIHKSTDTRCPPLHSSTSVQLERY